MINDVNNTANNQISLNKTGINQTRNIAPSFKANPNAVDTTPTADTYAPQVQPAGEQENPMGSLKYILPTWFVLHNGTNVFNKLNGGEYEKSLVGRLGKLGDRISETSLVNNSFVENMKSHKRTIKANLQSFIDKHPLLSAMQKTPTRPECSLVTNFLETQAEADVKEGFNKLSKYIEKGPKSLKELGATKDEINALKAKYGTTMFGRIKDLKGALRELEIERMGFDITSIPADEPMKNVRLSHLNLSLGDYEVLKKNPEKFGKIVEDSLKEGKAISPKLAQYFNKVKSISAPKSALGKFLPKAAKLGMRGLTFGGGLFNTLLVAFFMGEAVKNTIDAPKEQKVGTAAAGLLDAMSWVVAMPIALKAMHAVNGIQYKGMDKAAVEAFRNAQKTFNATAKAGGFATEAAYNTAKEAVLQLKNPIAPKGFWGKALDKTAHFLSIGLEQFAPYKQSTEGLTGAAKRSAKWANFKRFLPNLGKNFVGYPLRFALYAMVFSPIVEKVFSGVTSAIFGKPYEPEKIKEQEEKEAARRAELYGGPALLPNPEAVQGLQNVDENKLSDNNLIKQKLKELNALPKEGEVPAANPVQGQEPQTVNGVQINTTTDGTPYMPPEANNGVQNGGVNGQQNDPNKSEYDTVPRTYVPKIDWNNPFPYADPMAIPYEDHKGDKARSKYDRAQELYDRMDRVLNNAENI